VATTDTTTTYAVTNADVGFYLKVKETATDAVPSTLTTDSNVTFLIAATAPTMQTAPTISDTTSGSSTVNQGDALSVTAGTWSEPPDFSTYQWMRCAGSVCSNIPGATTMSYVPRRSDVDQTLKVQQTPHYGLTTLPSGAAQTSAVVPTAPANSPSDSPSISGDAVAGQTLVASTGTWSNQPDGYTYQWQRCDITCQPTGATDSSYVLSAADVGDTINVVVTAHVGTSPAGNGSATSASTGVVESLSAVSLTAAPGGPVTNQGVTLAATVTSRAAAGAPSGSVAFVDRGKPISGCGAVPVAPSGQSATVLCQTSFGAGSPQLTAIFTPAASSVVLGSSSPNQTLTVGRDTPTTTLDASSQVQVDASTTYTATVAPTAARSGPIQPSGSVEFLDGGQPIAGCTAQPLIGGGATCSVKYSATGSRSVVARYLGDANFAGSSSLAAAVRIATLPVKGTITATMQWTFSYAPTYTRVTSMVINGIPTGGTVETLCQGRGCPFAKRSTTIGKPKRCTGKAKRTHSCPVHGRVTLTSKFRRRDLRPGAKITIEIRRPRFVGKYYSFTVRPRKQPRVRIGCLAAVNGTRPDVGC
jgi:hypothetical protein